MAKHFLLDTRTPYQKVKDWVYNLFKKRPKKIENQEKHNRTILSTLNNSRSIEQQCVPQADYGSTCRRKCGNRFPLDSIAERRSCL